MQNTLKKNLSITGLSLWLFVLSISNTYAADACITGDILVRYPCADASCNTITSTGSFFPRSTTGNIYQYVGGSISKVDKQNVLTGLQDTRDEKITIAQATYSGAIKSQNEIFDQKMNDIDSNINITATTCFYYYGNATTTNCTDAENQNKKGSDNKYIVRAYTTNVDIWKDKYQNYDFGDLLYKNPNWKKYNSINDFLNGYNYQNKYDTLEANYKDEYDDAVVVAKNTYNNTIKKINDEYNAAKLQSYQRICTNSTCSSAKTTIIDLESSSDVYQITGGTSQTLTMDKIDNINLIHTTELNNKTKNSFAGLIVSKQSVLVGIDSFVEISSIFQEVRPIGCDGPISYSIEAIDPSGNINSNMTIHDNSDENTDNIKLTNSSIEPNIVDGIIHEKMWFSKIWHWNLRLKITDANGNISSMNLPGGIDVTVGYPSYTSVWWQKCATSISQSCIEKTSLDIPYYIIGDNILYRFRLRDISGNIITGYDKEITISNEKDIEWNIEYIWWTRLRPDANGYYTINMKAWSQVLYPEKFILTMNTWDSREKPLTDTMTFTLDYGGFQLVKDPANAGSDFVISCRNTPITISAPCITDDLSGCNMAKNMSRTFTSESENGSEWILAAYDNAGNIKQYKYVMNHLDLVAPAVKLTYKNNLITPNFSLLAASGSSLIFTVTDVTRPLGCNSDIRYDIRSTPANLFSKNGIITPSNPNIDLGTDIFNTVGTVDAAYVVKDSVWNQLVSSMPTIIVHPNNFWTQELTPSTSWYGWAFTPVSLIARSPATSTITTLEDSLFANNSDYYTYTLNFRDAFSNPITGKKIISIEQNCWTIPYPTCKTIMTNMNYPAFPIGDTALLISFLWWNVTDTNGNINITLKSLTPGVFTEKFKITIAEWDNFYLDTSTINSYFLSSDRENSFRKTFTGWLSILNIPYTLTLTNSAKIQLWITPTNTISDYLIEQFKDQISPWDEENHKVSQVNSAINLNAYPEIDLTLQSSSNQWAFIKPGIYIKNNPIIGYTLGGKPITYRLSATDSAYDMVPLYLGWIVWNAVIPPPPSTAPASNNVVPIPSVPSFPSVPSGENCSSIAEPKWLRIIGAVQWQWVYATDWAGNGASSDTLRNELRSSIQKNVALLTRGVSSWKTINGKVKYIEWNTNLDWEVNGYETLIVKNWNITITDNFNTQGKKIGLIVLRNGSDTNQWNIFITPTVRYIYASIYADGGLISIWFPNDSIWNYSDSQERVATLTGQLVIRGNIFSRNTIGWATVVGNSQYMLPWGIATTNVNLAKMYDLYYLRTSNYSCSKTLVQGGTSDVREWYTDHTLIITDPALISNPPIWFEK